MVGMIGILAMSINKSKDLEKNLVSGIDKEECQNLLKIQFIVLTIMISKV